MWKDEVGDTQEIPQGEGGGQGDPLMPFSLEAVLGLFRSNEKVFAFLDDIVVVCSPNKVVAVEAILREEPKRHAHIDVHQGKTQVWNRGGVAPRGIEELVTVARLVNPDAIVWKGDPSSPRELQEIGVLGAPIRSQEHVADQLQKKFDEQETLFTRIPRVGDTQALFLAFDVRVNQSELWLGTPKAPKAAQIAANFPTFHGRIWADISGEIQGRSVLVELGRLHKDDQGTVVANIVIEGIARDPAPCFQAVRRCEEALHDAGLETPTWRDVRVSTRARVAARTERAQVWLASRCQQDFRRAIPRNTKHADGVTTIPRLVVLSPSSPPPSRNCPLREDKF